MSSLRIGNLARAAGVTVETVRYYEREGVLPRPQRSQSGYRLYRPEALERLRFIKELQELGLTLAEISGLLRNLADARGTCAQERPRIASALERTERRLSDLTSLRMRLRSALSDCDSGKCVIAQRARRLTRG